MPREVSIAEKLGDTMQYAAKHVEGGIEVEVDSHGIRRSDRPEHPPSTTLRHDIT